MKKILALLLIFGMTNFCYSAEDEINPLLQHSTHIQQPRTITQAPAMQTDDYSISTVDKMLRRVSTLSSACTIGLIGAFYNVLDGCNSYGCTPIDDAPIWANPQDRNLLVAALVTNTIHAVAQLRVNSVGILENKKRGRDRFTAWHSCQLLASLSSLALTYAAYESQDVINSGYIPFSLATIGASFWMNVSAHVSETWNGRTGTTNRRLNSVEYSTLN